MELGITEAQLVALAPHIKPQRAGPYADALTRYLGAGDITTPLRLCHYIAQLAHESAGFKALEENLNYSPEGLLKFSRVHGIDHARQLVAQGPQAIGNCIYGGRLGNGDEASGDGYRYRGRGFIMITGKDNYTRVQTYSGLPVVANPDLLAQPDSAAQAAAFFWKSNNINVPADADDITAVTRIVNGGTLGLDERRKWLEQARTIWAPAIQAAGSAAAAAGAAAIAGGISRYFTLEELTFSDSAVRFQIDNTPTPDIVAALTDTAQRLDAVRELLAHPIQVNSGYRSAKLNAALHGAPNSAHTTGHAVDFVCRGFGPPLQICQAIIASGIKFDQLIQEGTWVHMSFDPAMRQQVLTAIFGGTGTHYRAGL